MLPHDSAGLLLEAARGAMVVVAPLNGGVAAARVNGISFQVERRVFVGYHLIPRPRAVEKTFVMQNDDDMKVFGFVPGPY